MRTVFVLMSGEHPTLPKAEVQAILEAENILFKTVGWTSRILKIKLEKPSKEREVCSLLDERSAYTSICGLEIFSCEASENKIFEETKNVCWDEWIQKGESFAVRVKKVGERRVFLDMLKLEKRIGEIVLGQKPNLYVNLEKPEKLFVGIISDEKFVFGLVLNNFRKKGFSCRTPRKKPFFHPSSLQPKLARCMVNLSRANKQKLLLDPFCGTGTILIEAGLMGIDSVGVELREKMVRGAKLNLNYYGVKKAYLIRANALKLPLTKVDCIATDPPYGRAASTLGCSTKTILEEFFVYVGEVLTEDGKICLASPKTVDVASLAEAYGFKVKETHLIYVHRSLTRELATFEKR